MDEKAAIMIGFLLAICALVGLYNALRDVSKEIKNLRIIYESANYPEDSKDINDSYWARLQADLSLQRLALDVMQNHLTRKT